MKKSLAIFVMLLLLLTMVACGTEGNDSKTSDVAAGKTDQSQIESKDSAATNSSATETSTDATGTTAASQEAPETSESSSDQPTVAFEELTVVDNDQCLVKITGFEKDEYFGYKLKVYLENKTSDKDLRCSVTAAAVNGVSWNPYFAVEVAPGKKKNDSITFMDDTLQALLPKFTDIELTMRVYDSNDWMADDFAKETVHIYPYGADQASLYVRESQPTDTVLVDNDQISIVVTGYDPDGYFGYTMNTYLVNKTDKALVFNCDDASVNGFMCDPFWMETVPAGKVSFSSMDWSESSFQENGIDQVEEIEMSIMVYEEDNWSSDGIFKETFTLKP